MTPEQRKAQEDHAAKIRAEGQFRRLPKAVKEERLQNENIRSIAQAEIRSALASLTIQSGNAMMVSGSGMNITVAWQCPDYLSPSSRPRVPDASGIPNLDLNVYDTDGTTLLHTGTVVLKIAIDDADPDTTAQLSWYKTEFCVGDATMTRFILGTPLV